MEIIRNSLDTTAGPREWFTSTVYVDAVAAPTRFVTHLALQQADADGRVMTWGAHVSDQEYGATPRVAEA